MLYDQMVNLPHRWYRQCQADLSSGIPPIVFNSRLVQQAVPFRIDEVASHYFNSPIDYAPDDFNNLVPRYPRMWFEFTQPKRGRIGNTWNDYEAALKETLGDQVNISSIIRGIFVQSWDRFNEADTVAFHPIDSRVRWLYRAIVFFSLDGIQVSDIFSGMSWQVDDRGGILFFGGPRQPYIFDTPKVYVTAIGLDEVKAHITGSVLPVIMALSLLQNKDVSVGTISPRKKRKKIKRSTRRARRAAKKIPRDSSFYEHHVIQVNPMKPGGKGSGQASGKKRKKAAYHQVPGGFRTYGGIDPVTNEKRGLLFGKYAGTFYVPAHERGIRERGTITKEYEVHNE